MADRGRGRGRGDFGGGFGGRGRGGYAAGRGQPAQVYGGEGTAAKPDPDVTKVEDTMVKGDMVSLMAATSIDSAEIQLPKRPAYGTKGKAIVLHTNYFELKGVTASTPLYRYSVSIQPDEDMPKPKRKRLIQLLLAQQPFAGLPIASDWAQILVSPKRIPLNENRGSYKLEWYPADGTPLPDASPNESAKISQARKKNTRLLLVEDIGDVSMSELLNDLRQPATTYPLKLETIQALNVIMAFCPSSDPNISVAAGNKFYPFGSHPQRQAARLGGALEALRGYFSSVRTGPGRMLLNVNVATGAFYQSGPLIPIMKEWTGGSPPRDNSQQMKLAAFLRRLRFETNYITEVDQNGNPKKDAKGQIIRKRKIHTVNTLSQYGQNAENITFQEVDAQGKTKAVNLVTYFKRKYGITLNNPKAPVVDYGTLTDPKYVPAELCSILPGQLAKRLLLGPQTSEMIRFAARRPHENAQSIMTDGLQVTKLLPVANGLNTKLSPFGIKVTPKLLTVLGRILAPPRLLYRGQAACNPNNGAWNLDTRTLGQKPFRLAKPLGDWSVLVINERVAVPNREVLMQCLIQFRKMMETYGLNPGPVPSGPKLMSVNIEHVHIQNKNVAQIQHGIGDTLRKSSKPHFLFVILPNDNAVIYDSIKHFCDVVHGIPNICSIGSKFCKEKGQMQYFANVIMKFNQKLGGVNHTISPQDFAPLDSQTIVVGIDVTHPSPGSSDQAPSIAGIVASVDDKFSQYPASMRTQKGRQEMVANLDQMIAERFKLWHKRNGGRLPTKVIVYRDGVSEGQYRTVITDEYPAFVKAFDSLYGKGKHPKISIIMVGKRHNTRFYPTKIEDTDGRTGNPKPGTVVDRGVTGEKLFDFFLQAHQGLQGTCKPAHYVVLKDENKLGADQLQSLTHNLCYTFARATRSVSVCPPAYYADLLCERGRSYLQGELKGDASIQFSTASWQSEVHANLRDTMYYL